MPGSAPGNSTPSMPFPIAMGAAAGAPAPQSHRQPAPVDEQAVTHFEPAPPQSSTLASLGLSTGTTPVPTGHAPNVAVIEVVPAGNAAAQASAPAAAPARSGVRGFVVFLLVLFALAAGFVAGYVAARM